MNKNKGAFFNIVVSGIVGLAGFPVVTFAQSSSNNYKVEESYFGSGGQVDATSNNYRARQSAGALGVGSASSNNFDAVAGSNTPTEPFLEVFVTGANVDLGVLSDTTPSYGVAQAGDCNCSFSVRSYLTSDYVVVSGTPPPTSENNVTLANKATQAAPSTSTATEEFGINLADNSTPDIGASPKNQPDDTFADGSAATGYQLPDQYKYGIGDIIARSPATAGNPGVGKTDYTITYMAKAKTLTPAGNYRMNHIVVVIASF